MITVHKYELSPTFQQTFRIMGLQKVLSVMEQRDHVVIYVQVDTELIEQIELEILVVGTGHDAGPVEMGYNFLGTVKLEGGMLMFHVFYKDWTLS